MESENPDFWEPGTPDPSLGDPFGFSGAQPHDPGRSPSARAREALAAAGYTDKRLIVGDLVAAPRTMVYAAAEGHLVQVVREVYGSGWQPAELVRQVRLKTDAATTDLVRWSIAAERRADGLSAVDPRWRQQFDQAGPPTTGTGKGWLSRWAESRGIPYHTGVSLLVTLLETLVRAPRIELIVPPPPGITVRQAVHGTTSTETNPVLSKVRALLAKAESTDHEAEASAFTAKAHELMTRHAIDRAMLDHTRHHDRGKPNLVRLPVDPPYPDAKALLLQTISAQSRCKAVFLTGLQMSTVIGYPADLEAVELLFTSLLVQAQHALAETVDGAPAGSRQRSTRFRAAFLTGFASRIGDRLAEVNRLAYADAEAETFLPVLQSQEDRINDFVSSELGIEEHSSAVRGGYDPLGYQHGAMAGEAANLTAGAVGG